jgi:hypothetical protein
LAPDQPADDDHALITETNIERLASAVEETLPEPHAKASALPPPTQS